jgi:hypothetical protein
MLGFLSRKKRDQAGQKDGMIDPATQTWGKACPKAEAKPQIMRGAIRRDRTGIT